MLRLAVFLGIFSLFSVKCLGQCPLPPPNPNNCGLTVSNLQYTGSNTFCFNSCVTYTVSYNAYIDSVCFNFADGNTLTLYPTGLDTTITYCYNFQPDDTCYPGGYKTIAPEAVLYKDCMGGITTRQSSVTMFVIFKPRPLFSFSSNPVCEDVLFDIIPQNPLNACTNSYPTNPAQYFWIYNNIDTIGFDLNNTNNSYQGVVSYSISTPGIHTITLTASNFCGTNSLSLPINIRPKPSIAPVLTSDTCSIAYITAIANQNNVVDTIVWSVSGGSGVTITPVGNSPYDVDIVIPNPGTYTINANASGYCCSAYIPPPCHWDTTITIYSGPQITANNYLDSCNSITFNFLNDFGLSAADSLICTVDSINTSGIPINIFSFNGNGNPGTYTISLPGTYVVTVSSINACDSVGTRDTVRILDPTIVSVVVTPPGTCTPDSMVVISTISNNATGYNWNTFPTTGISPTNTTLQTPIFNITQPGTYTITLQASGCCSSPASNCDTSFQYTLGQGPSINIATALDDGCNSLTIQFSSVFSTPTDADTVHWNISTIGGVSVYDTLTYIPPNPPAFPPDYILSTPDTFIIIATAINFCDSITAVDTVILYPNAAVVLQSDTTICYSSPVLPLSTFGVATPSPGYWTVNGIVTNVFDPSLYPASSNNIVVYIYDPGIVSCVTSDTVLVSVLGNTVNAGTDTLTLCSNGANDTLQNFTPPNGTWTGSPAIVDPVLGIINPQLIPTPYDTLIYTVDFSTAFSGCFVSDSLILIPFALSANNSLAPDTVCSNNQPVVFTNPLLNSQFFVDFGNGTISPPTTNPTIQYTYPGTDSTYYVSATITQSNSPFCSTIAYDTITILTPPQIAFTLDTNKICQNDSITIITGSSIFNSYTTYTWTDGNGTTYNTFNPGSISYPPTLNDSDTYIIKVVASNFCGSDTIEFSVTVYSSPHAQFIYTADNYPSPCSGDTIKFENISYGGATNFSWTINGITVSNDSILNDTTLSAFNTDSIYIISLIAANKCDTSVFSDTIIVHPSIIIPSFFITAPKSCVNDTITFNSNVSSYQLILWDFGDGNNDTGYVAPHAYGSAGSYIVTQIVVGWCGTDSLKDTVLIQNLPTVAFTATPVPLCSNVPVCFNNLSSGVGTLIYTWDFGDGTTSNNTSPCHQYATPGIKNVSLTVTDFISIGGCTDSLLIPITVNQSPVAQLTLSDTIICLHDSIQFSSSAAGQNFYWNMGDGNNQIGNPFYYQYATDSTYTVLLTVTSSSGCSDTISSQVIVHPDATAAFGWSQIPLCNLPSSIIFSNQSINAGIYNWNFGLYGNSPDSIPTLDTLTATASFIALLIANNSYNCPDTLSHPVTFMAPPFAAFQFNSNGSCDGTPVQFINLSPDSSNSVWYFGDGGTSLLSSPVHTYSTFGSYNVSLIVTNDSLCKDTLTQTVTINPNAVAQFTTSQIPLCQSPSVIYFQNNSDSASFYTWDLGLYGNSNLSNPQLDTLTVQTTFNATLIANNSYGCPDTVTHPVTFHAVPQSSFTWNPLSVCHGTPITFANTSINGISYLWNFGDSTTSTLFTPSHQYSNPGNYTVTLITYNDTICSDTIIHVVEIHDNAVAQFSYAQIPLCEMPDTIFFNNQSTNASQYDWDFGLYGTSSAPNPHLDTLTVQATFNAILIANNIHDCPDTITYPVTYHAVPVANFVSQPGNVCLGSSINFINQSVNSLAPYTWYFGDGGSSIQFSPSYTYADTGSYHVSLVVHNDTSCTDTARLIVNIFPYAEPHFSYTQDPECGIPSNIQFNSDSSQNTTIYNWLFNLGGFTTSNAPNPVLNNINVTGTFPITLIAGNIQNCPDTITLPVTIYPQPVAAFSSNDSTVCLNGILNFNNLSSGADVYLWDLGNGFTSGQFSIDGYNYSAPGVYTITLIASNAVCSDTVQHLQIIDSIPGISINFFVADTSISGIAASTTCSIYQFNSLSASDSLLYNWQFGDGGISNFQNPQHNFLTNGHFNISLIVTNESECSNSIDTSLDVECDGTLYIPNALAPTSGAGETALFIVKGRRLATFKIEIFSPMGTRVYISEEINPDDGSPVAIWDGTYKNQPLPQGAYVWKAEAMFTNGKPWDGMKYHIKDQPSKIGTVTLIR